jgi:ABC-2 type transport system ATP-binding protein
MTPTTAAGSEYAIVTHGLTRTYNGGIEAARAIELTVGEGEVFGFLGPNGAGKTTIVRMLCTLLPPTSGTAFVARLDVVANATEVRQRIGVALLLAPVFRRVFEVWVVPRFGWAVVRVLAV